MSLTQLDNLIAEFAKLPGIGRVTAQRLALHVIKKSRGDAELLASALINAKDGIKYCETCFNFTEISNPLCEICRDKNRDHSCVCVVEQASDVLVLEVNAIHKGVFHVLGGLLSPLDGVGPEDLRIKELAMRVSGVEVCEVILAFNAGPEGDATSSYLYQLLSEHVGVSRPARGLPVGADLDLADGVTLSHAFAGRSTLE
ncbi:MAG: recombination mediator RecR [Candidatus Latescibacterota bacterium]|mgnify:CR=1 FL=1|nr:recombination mediator RecR [Candidatus Latescibacterota bacterium]